MRRTIGGNMLKWLSLLTFVGVSLLAGFIGSLATTPAIPTWYQSLSKPVFNPPNWLFAPVWTLLFILMGIAAWLVFTKGNKQKAQALKLFFIQLLFNTLWSILFFGFKSPALAFGEIIILWILIYQTKKAFLKQDKLAGWLLLPYLAWVSFAFILNFSIVMLN